jgi:hypothetical protein
MEEMFIEKFYKLVINGSLKLVWYYLKNADCSIISVVENLQVGVYSLT